MFDEVPLVLRTLVGLYISELINYVLIVAVLYITTVETLATINLMATVILLRLYYFPADRPLPSCALRLIGQKQVTTSEKNPDQLVTHVKEAFEEEKASTRMSSEQIAESTVGNPWHEVVDKINKIFFYITFVMISGASFMLIIMILAS